MPCCRSVRFRRRTTGRASPFHKFRFTDVAVIAPDSVVVSSSVDFAIVVAHEPNVVGRRLVTLFRLIKRHLDSQRETCHVRSGKGCGTNLNSLISRAMTRKIQLL